MIPIASGAGEGVEGNFLKFPSEKQSLFHFDHSGCPLGNIIPEFNDGDDEVRLRSLEPSKDKYMRPISQASLFSIRTALIKRKQACSLGKIPTTRVRRLTS